ncbi:MAG: hypothetical protein ABIL76_00965 [candidate division WOR-3 bacterium]
MLFLNFQFTWSGYSDIHIADEQIKSVKEIGNGFLITGYFYNDDGYADVIIMKIDKLGNVVWAKYFGDFYVDDVGYDILILNDGFLIFGTTNQGSIDGYNDLFLAKFTNNGDLIWAKIYKYPGQVYANEIIRDSNSYILVSKIAPGNVSLHPFVINVDTNGNIIWAKFYGYPSDIQEYSPAYYFDRIALKINDGFFILGSKIYQVQPSYHYDIYLLKIDNNENPLWAKSYGGDNVPSHNENASSIIKSIDGNYYIIGSYGSFSVSQYGIYLLKIDQNGNLIKSKVYYQNMGASSGLRIFQNNDKLIIPYSNYSSYYPLGILVIDTSGSIFSNKQQFLIRSDITDIIETNEGLFAIGYTLDNNAKPFEVNFNFLDKIGFSCNQNIDVSYLSSNAFTNVQNLQNPSVDDITNNIIISDYNILPKNKSITITLSCLTYIRETTQYKINGNIIKFKNTVKFSIYKPNGSIYFKGYGNEFKFKENGLYFIKLENEVFRVFIP